MSEYDATPETGEYEGPVKKCGLAVTSLILSIVGIISALFCIGVLFSIPAVICGHIGLSKINKSEEMLTGKRMAIAGLIMGYLGIGIAALAIVLMPMVAIAVPSFVKARTVSQQNACINNLRQIESAKEQWAMSAAKNNGAPCVIAEVNQFVRGGTTPLCPVGGIYTYNPIGTAAQCTITSPEHKY